MDDERKACVILTRKSDGSFEVMDARGQVFEGLDEAGLGEACSSILDDDTLPRVTTPTSFQLQLSGLAEQATQVMAKRVSNAGKTLVPLMTPMLEGAANGIARVREDRRRESHVRQRSRDCQEIERRRTVRARLLQGRGQP